MALTDNLTAEKQALTTLLESEYTQQNLRDSLLERLYYVRFLLGELGGGGGGGDASAAKQDEQTGYLTSISNDSSSIAVALGDTSGNPEPHTTAWYLKQIHTGIGDQVTSLAAIDGNVSNIKDDVVTLLTSINNATSPNLIFSSQNIGGANAGVIKASSGSVFSVYCENENTAKRYLLLLNQTTTPVNGQTPVRAYGVPSNGAIVIDKIYFGALGLLFDTGIAWAFSSTKNTVTLATASDCISEVSYV